MKFLPSSYVLPDDDQSAGPTDTVTAAQKIAFGNRIREQENACDYLVCV
jgi:hypothetical protein